MQGRKVLLYFAWSRRGETGAPNPLVAKVSCMDQQVLIPGLPLPTP